MNYIMWILKCFRVIISKIMCFQYYNIDRERERNLKIIKLDFSVYCDLENIKGIYISG